MADVPDQLTLERHRDLVGRERRPVVRWVLLAIGGAFALAGVANAFGQRPDTQVVETPVATFKVYAPTKLRGGVYYEARFHIDAREEIREATLVLDPGWIEGMTLNSLVPSPVDEASRDGRIAYELGHIPRGGTHLFFLQFQVNPTNVGRRSADVDLADGERLLAHVDRTVTIYP
jgi:hypothetical protein